MILQLQDGWVVFKILQINFCTQYKRIRKYRILKVLFCNKFACILSELMRPGYMLIVPQFIIGNLFYLQKLKNTNMQFTCQHISPR